jgi:hypothetical protein
MNRDIAIRIDGMLLNAIGAIDGIAHYMKNNLSDSDYKSLIYMIGTAMGNLTDASGALHKIHPDITPQELRPGA